MKRDQPPPTPSKDSASPTQFGPPIVAPGVNDPEALRYARDIQGRRGPQMPTYQVPVAGGPSPSIPRLDAPAAEGLTMADQAQVQRTPNQAPSMFQEGPSASPPRMPGISRPQTPASPLLPGDILPDEATKDPAFQNGGGSMYAVSQPGLAAKYGVIRGGRRLLPQQLGQATKGLRPETLEGLKALRDAQQPTAAADAKAEHDAVVGVAGAAGRFGNAPTDGPQADPQANEENLRKAVKNLDDFDFATFRDMLMKDILNNDEQRTIVESRCQSMTIDAIVTDGFVTQKVPIIPGKFEPTYQSLSGQEDLTIKRLIMLEAKGLEVSDRYLLDKFSLMSLALGVRAINNNPLPDHQDQKGEFDADLFWRKFNWLLRMPYHMLASLAVNFFWFDVRVRKLFVAERLGNG